MPATPDITKSPIEVQENRSDGFEKSKKTKSVELMGGIKDRLLKLCHVGSLARCLMVTSFVFKIGDDKLTANDRAGISTMEDFVK